MNQFSAADNHIITIADGRWRLVHNERPLAEASPRGFRYSGRFGSTRRLPSTGEIVQEDIQQVVLGWQQTDESWHLGLILDKPLADRRGSRWIEMVYWPDPEISVFQDLAQTTGQQLAQSLGIPFYVIPPQPVEPAAPPRPLPDLPLAFGYWQMEAIDPDKGRYVIKRTQAWSWHKIGRVAWYSFWALCYLALSLATVFSDIALPNTGTLLPDPQILPYLGIGTSFGLMLAALYQFYLMTTKYNEIYVDGVRGAISAWRGKKMHWLVPLVEIQSIYVSEVVKKREQPPATEYGELNLHLGGGDFQYILRHEESEDNDNIPQPDLVMSYTETIRELDREVISTNLQAAAAYISEAFDNVPIWYDLRVK